MSQLKKLAKAGGRAQQHRGAMRVTSAWDGYAAILLNDPHPDWQETEAQLVGELGPVFPDASPLMRRAALRLSLGFVLSVPALLQATIPAHYFMLRNYHWGLPNAPEEAEGAGRFWLFEASNNVTDAYEDHALPGLSQYFIPNMFQPLAVRSWIRLQSAYFDPAMSGTLISIAEKYGCEQHDIFAVTARCFVDGDDALPQTPISDEVTTTH